MYRYVGWVKEWAGINLRASERADLQCAIEVNRPKGIPIVVKLYRHRYGSLGCLII